MCVCVYIYIHQREEELQSDFARLQEAAQEQAGGQEDVLEQLKTAAAETDEKLVGSSERVVALERELRVVEDRAKTDMEASAEQIEALQHSIDKLEEKLAESSSHELALQELQAASDGYKGELEASMQRVEALEDGLAQAREAADKQVGGQTHLLQQLQTAAAEKDSNLEARGQQVEALESELRCVCEYVGLFSRFSFLCFDLG